MSLGGIPLQKPEDNDFNRILSNCSRPVDIHCAGAVRAGGLLILSNLYLLYEPFLPLPSPYPILVDFFP